MHTYTILRQWEMPVSDFIILATGDTKWDLKHFLIASSIQTNIVMFWL